MHMDVPSFISALDQGEIEAVATAVPDDIFLADLERRTGPGLPFETERDFLGNVSRRMLLAELAIRGDSSAIENLLTINDAGDESATDSGEPITVEEHKRRLYSAQVCQNAVSCLRRPATTNRIEAIRAAAEGAGLTRRTIAAAMGVTSARVQQLLGDTEHEPDNID